MKNNFSVPAKTSLQKNCLLWFLIITMLCIGCAEIAVGYAVGAITHGSTSDKVEPYEQYRQERETLNFKRKENNLPSFTILSKDEWKKQQETLQTIKLRVINQDIAPQSQID